MIKEILKDKNISIYQLSKATNIPYSTFSDIINENTKLENISSKYLYALSKLLNIPMEKLLEESMEVRLDYETFKSKICHDLKNKGDLSFIENELINDNIHRYYKKHWYFEVFYVLALIDYLSRINNISLCNVYDDIRSYSLKEPIYPKDIMLKKLLSNSKEIDIDYDQ